MDTLLAQWILWGHRKMRITRIANKVIVVKN